MILEAITWNVNPKIFTLFGKMEVRWYGLLFASGFLFGYLIFSKFFKKEKLPSELLDKLTIYMAIGTILGARLGHCLFYEPSYYLKNPLEILMVWKGGLASHGAAIGILIALFLFSRKYKKPFIWILDRIVVVVALAGAFIRLGNLMNSEIYGIETNLPWGFIFVRNQDFVPKHPTQIYESLMCLIIFGLLLWIYYKNDAKPRPGLMFGLFLVILFVFRFFVEYIKEVQVDFESTMPINMGQILSIPFIIIGIIVLVWSYKHKPK